MLPRSHFDIHNLTEVKPRLVIQIKKQKYLYVYKAKSGESWFEYETDKGMNDSMILRLNATKYC